MSKMDTQDEWKPAKTRTDLFSLGKLVMILCGVLGCVGEWHGRI